MKPSLVMCDDDENVLWAIGLESKGRTERIVKHVKGVPDMSEYEGNHMIFKTDQEPLIIAVKRAVAAA